MPRSSTSACPTEAGDALAAELRARFASLPIVIASGYRDGFRHGLGDDALVGFLDKPYDSAQLAALLSRLGVRARG